jgi:ATP-dependent helicase/nuclease subunit B
VQAHFLLGPAGSGKSFRCLSEIRAQLIRNPEGAPLVLLAPKQATFQLERQLLADPSLHGYTRLHIFSFERLARFILDELGIIPPKLLNEEGRLMVLRALLLRHADELKLFRRSARRPGFAPELGRLLNELQQHQLTAGKLHASSQSLRIRSELRDKLHDLALLSEKYADWLCDHELQDANHLLDFAIAALRQPTPSSQLSTLMFDGLWLDGFAEMTPQELDLLAAAIPFCQHATLAFCLDESAAHENEDSWLSIWNVVGKSLEQCRRRIANLPGCESTVEVLRRDPVKSRFAKSPALQRLEAGWQRSGGVSPAKSGANETSALRIMACPNSEAEAAFAAREILKFVRAGNRFCDCAVLVRNLENYHKPVGRAFHQYGIPFFLDRREDVAHHPLAELTRNALRTVAFDWRPEDWFATLKAGFSPVQAERIDELENAALEFGWHGQQWRKPLPDEAGEKLRKIIFPPFENFSAQLAKMNFKPDGAQLAEALRELWSSMQVETILERWTLDEEPSAVGRRPPATHQTVWDQMNAWLDNVALAFPREPLPLRDWLPVLEAGLAGLTVGVIPPALDQVLVGAIDRARNPDLKLALVLGVNETLFPAATAEPAILTDAERGELAMPLGPDRYERLARERYYGYIACTRASERLVVTHARKDAEGRTLNPSPFIAHLKNIFPGFEVEEFSGEIKPAEAEHTQEVIVPLLELCSSGREYALSENQRRFTPAITDGWQNLLELPSLKLLAESLGALHEPEPTENLLPALAEKLYGPPLRTSVSRLEEFASCPFRYFVRSGLRAEERKLFELDARERGSFQHEVLKEFHEDLTAEGKRWRDLTPAAARERIANIAAGIAQSADYRHGLLRDSAQTRFEARALTAALQDFVEVIIGWMRGQYEFNPAAAELGFGGKDDRAPAWEIVLGAGHTLALQGRIDRVDLWRDQNSESALAVVADYKSGGKKLDSLLVNNGIQLQLLAYLGALRYWQNPRDFFGADKIVPAGAFYVNLRGEYPGDGSRAEILAEADESRRLAYRHTGRFDAGVLDRLDRLKAKDQFSYQLKKNGELYANSTEALPRAEFEKLLDGVETQLREMGERILSGAAQVDPYRRGKQTPCEFCDFAAACRIDKWTHSYRVLRAASTPGE